ncbi:hypothetical protein [Streptomyces sp. NPDC020965]|uniref:hypothetical protein n=1 Tax=Streptomyces sp. NPDC020965 TaxID=3365105 RepID=UPI0037A823AF
MQTRLGEQPLLIGLGHQPALRVPLAGSVRPPRRGVGLGRIRRSEHPGDLLPVRLPRTGCPAALLPGLQVRGERVREMSVCCWQYAAMSMDAMSMVSETSVARISVIRFQSRAMSGSV